MMEAGFGSFFTVRRAAPAAAVDLDSPSSMGAGGRRGLAGTVAKGRRLGRVLGMAVERGFGGWEFLCMVVGPDADREDIQADRAPVRLAPKPAQT